MRCGACDAVWLVSGPEEKSKRAAVVKRGAEREHRDLFASRPADMGSVKQTLRPPPPDYQPSGVAARNETSVLFTVDALRGIARAAEPEAEPEPLVSAFHADDDDGIIDLHALASSRPKAVGGSVTPLFPSETPAAAFTADVSDSGPRAMQGGLRLGKRALIGIAAAAVAVVLCAFGIAAAFKGEEPVRRASAAMTIIAAGTAAVSARAAPAPAPAAAPAPSSSDDDREKTPVVSAKKVKTRSKGAPRGSSSGQKAQSSGAAKSASDASDTSVAKAAPKAADKCGCKGDFDCVLRCAATGK